MADQVVRVVGSTLCYQITTVAVETTVYQDYDTSIPAFANCEACDPTPPEPNGFRVTQSGQPDNEVQQNASNPRSQGERVITTINAECWTLQEPVVTTTGNTILSDCPPDLQCTLSIMYGGSNVGGGTFSATGCDGEAFNTVAIAQNLSLIHI